MIAGRIAARRAGVLAGSLLLLLAPFLGAGGAAEAPRQPGGQRPAEALTVGRTLERSLLVGETHAYALSLDAGETAVLLLERRGVAAILTVFGPGGETLGTYGSAVLEQGTERITFLGGEGGEHRIAVRTFFAPSPPGAYLLTLAEVRGASDRERRELAMSGCREEDWTDREDNFLVDTALEAISRCLRAVANRLETDFPDAATLAAEADPEVEYLKENWHWGEFVSPAYQESLVQTYAVLGNAAEDPDAEKALGTLEAVVEDLKIKAEHCRKSNRGLGEDVVVTVRTRRGAREDVPGWVVYYKLGIFMFTQGREPNRFGELSSPSKARLPAGRYLMWAGKPGEGGEEKARKELIRVGGGTEDLRVDLLVP